METSNEIQEKLKKLIRHRDSAEKVGNLEEAESFAQKIQELALKYGVEISKLSTAEQEHINAPFDKEVDLTQYMRRHESDWILKLFTATSRGNMCQIVSNTSRTWIHIFGYEHNVDIAIFMAEQLISKFRELARKDFREYKGATKRNTYIRGWLQGAAQAIQERLSSKLAQAKQADVQVNALVVKSETAITEYKHKKYPKLGVMKNRSLSGTDGRAQGYETGKKLAINKGVSGSMKSSKLLN